MQLAAGALIIAVFAAIAYLQPDAMDDGIDGFVDSILFCNSTEYATGYSLSKFNRVKPGMVRSEVRGVLGDPIYGSWVYLGHGSDCGWFVIEDGLVKEVDHCSGDLVRVGTPGQRLLEMRGAPDREYWVYSRSPKSCNYRERVIRFENGTVTEIIKKVYVD